MLQFLENGRITQKVFVLRMSDLLKVPFLYYVIKSKSKLVDFHVILSCSLSNHLQEVVPFFCLLYWKNIYTGVRLFLMFHNYENWRHASLRKWAHSTKKVLQILITKLLFKSFSISKNLVILVHKNLIWPL